MLTLGRCWTASLQNTLRRDIYVHAAPTPICRCRRHPQTKRLPRVQQLPLSRPSQDRVFQGPSCRRVLAAQTPLASRNTHRRQAHPLKHSSKNGEGVCPAAAPARGVASWRSVHARSRAVHRVALC